MKDVNNFELNKSKRIKSIRMENECAELVKLEVFLDLSSDVVFRATKIKKNKKNNEVKK